MEKGITMENVLNIKKVVVQCNHCNSEIRFDLDSSIKMRSLHSCPMCGTLYGIDPEDDVIVRAQDFIRSAKGVKGAKFSFLCEGE